MFHTVTDSDGKKVSIFDIIPDTLSLEEQVNRNIRSARIKEELSKLPASFRDCIALYHYGCFSYKQIAEILNIDIGTVGSRINRGLKLLRKSLADLQSE